MEINLSDKEFKMVVIKILTELGKRMNEQCENLNKEVENIKKSQTKVTQRKKTVTELKNTLWGWVVLVFNSRPDETEE